MQSVLPLATGEFPLLTKAALKQYSPMLHDDVATDKTTLTGERKKILQRSQSASGLGDGQTRTGNKLVRTRSHSHIQATSVDDDNDDDKVATARSTHHAWKKFAGDSVATSAPCSTKPLATTANDTLIATTPHRSEMSSTLQMTQFALVNHNHNNAKTKAKTFFVGKRHSGRVLKPLDQLLKRRSLSIDKTPASMVPPTTPASVPVPVPHEAHVLRPPGVQPCVVRLRRLRPTEWNNCVQITDSQQTQSQQQQQQQSSEQTVAKVQGEMTEYRPSSSFHCSSLAATSSSSTELTRDYESNEPSATATATTPAPATAPAVSTVLGPTTITTTEMKCFLEQNTNEDLEYVSAAAAAADVDVDVVVKNGAPVAARQMVTIAEVLKTANDHKVVENASNVSYNNNNNDEQNEAVKIHCESGLVEMAGMVEADEGGVVVAGDKVKMTIKRSRYQWCETVENSENSENSVANSDMAVRKSPWRTKAEMKGNPADFCPSNSNSSDNMHIDSDFRRGHDNFENSPIHQMPTMCTNDIDGRLGQSTLTAEHVDAAQAAFKEQPEQNVHMPTQRQQQQQQQQQQQDPVDEYGIENCSRAIVAASKLNPSVNKATTAHETEVGVRAKEQSPTKPVKLIIERKRGRRYRCKQQLACVGVTRGRKRKVQPKVAQSLLNSIIQTLESESERESSVNAREYSADCAGESDKMLASVGVGEPRSIKETAMLGEVVNATTMFASSSNSMHKVVATSAELLVRVPLSALSADFQQKHCTKTRLDEQQHDSKGSSGVLAHQQRNHNACLPRLPRDEAENAGSPDAGRQLMKQPRNCPGDSESKPPNERLVIEGAREKKHDTLSAPPLPCQDLFVPQFQQPYHQHQYNQQHNNQLNDQSDFREFVGISQEFAKVSLASTYSNKITDFIGQFQSHFIEGEQPITAQVPLCMAPAVQPLSATHMSEMHDVETTLNGILSEMQDQHIYTPVSSHADDFFNQSVYSPLTEPPNTPSPSIYAESPGLTTSPFAPQQQQQQQQKQQKQQIDASTEQTLDTDMNNFPGFGGGEPFTEDSTQSELIGFQNNIPCFENIDQMSSPTSAASTPKRQSARLESAKEASPTVINYLDLAESATGVSMHTEIEVHTPTFNTSATSMDQLLSTEGVAIVNTGEGFVRATDVVDDELKQYAAEYAQLLNEFHPMTSQQQSQQLAEETDIKMYSNNNMAATTTTTDSTQFMQITNNMQVATTVVNDANDNAKTEMYTLKNGSLSVYAPTLTRPPLQWDEARRSQIDAATTTTTYYINTADLYHNNLRAANNTSTTLATLQQRQPRHQQQTMQLEQYTRQQQQQAVYEIDKRVMDANDNYIEKQQQQQQQQLMILTIPQEATARATPYPQEFTAQTVYLQSPLATPPTPTATRRNTFNSNEGVHSSNGLNLLQNNGTAHFVTNMPVPSLSPLSVQQQHVPQTHLQLHHYQQQQQQQQPPPPPPPQQQQKSSQQQLLQQKRKQRVSTSKIQKQQELKQLKALPDKTQTQQHQQQQQQQQETSTTATVSLMCRFCHKRQKFTNNRDYSNHIIAMHPAETPFNCPHCPLYFTRRTQRQQHIIIEHGVQRFECAPCGENFLTQRSLDLHLQRHHALDDDGKQKHLQQQQQQQQLQVQQQQQEYQSTQQVTHTPARRYVQRGRGRGRGGGRGRGRGRGRLDGGGTRTTPYELVRVDNVHLHMRDGATKDKRCEYHISNSNLDSVTLTPRALRSLAIIWKFLACFAAATTISLVP